MGHSACMHPAGTLMRQTSLCQYSLSAVSGHVQSSYTLPLLDFRYVPFQALGPHRLYAQQLLVRLILRAVLTKICPFIADQ